jgi:hypothetical protein
MPHFALLSVKRERIHQRRWGEHGVEANNDSKKFNRLIAKFANIQCKQEVVEGSRATSCAKTIAAVDHVSRTEGAASKPTN